MVVYEKQTVEQGKVLAALCYIGVFLFIVPVYIVPFVMKPRNEYAIAHARLAISMLVVTTAFGMLFTFFSILTCGLASIFYPFVVVTGLCAVGYGMFNAITGKVPNALLIAPLAKMMFGTDDTGAVES